MTSQEICNDTNKSVSSSTSSMSGNMKRVHRGSIDENFEVTPESPIPEVPQGGARVRVCFAGACYTDRQVEKSGQKRPKLPGIRDTSLFPGYEVSGVIDAMCNTVANNEHGLKVGDRVIVYNEELDELVDSGYAEYIIVHDIENLVKLPMSVNLEMASLLPCGALIAYNALMRAKPFIEAKVEDAKKDRIVNVLIVGAGGLGLWTIKMCNYVLGHVSERVRITVADTNIEKLIVAKDHGCFDVVHWLDALHEPYLLERTKSVCGGGVDVVIDFVSSPRTTSRAMKVLNMEGVLLVGGNAKYEISFCLNSLGRQQQSILGVNRGTREQLRHLVQAFADKKITPPVYTVFPVDEANKVFEQLNECKIQGRAVLRLSSLEEHGDDAVFAA